MGKRWFFYLSALLGCVVFHLAYQQWISWIILRVVLTLPVFSLVISLPAMLMARPWIQLPPAVSVGTPLVLKVVVRDPLPIPMCRMSVEAFHTVTGESWLLDANSDCPTDHCGGLHLRPRRGWIYDYLGLFRIPLPKVPPMRVLIRPKPVALPEPDLDHLLVSAWRPKPGGGFAENHELREYRPGDHLSQIHWKLTAKTQKLILREPMVPDQSRLILWLTLSGTPEQTDRKLGQLAWLGRYLRSRELPFQILAFTGSGRQIWTVDRDRDLPLALDQLLCHTAYAGTDTPTLTEDAVWSFYIGGEANEEA